MSSNLFVAFSYCSLIYFLMIMASVWWFPWGTLSSCFRKKRGTVEFEKIACALNTKLSCPDSRSASLSKTHVSFLEACWLARGLGSGRHTRPAWQPCCALLRSQPWLHPGCLSTQCSNSSSVCFWSWDCLMCDGIDSFPGIALVTMTTETWCLFIHRRYRKRSCNTKVRG